MVKLTKNLQFSFKLVLNLRKKIKFNYLTKI